MSSRPLSRQWRRNASTSNGSDRPWSSVSVQCFEIGRQLVAGMRGGALEQIVDLLPRSSTIGSMPFLKQLL